MRTCVCVYLNVNRFFYCAFDDVPLTFSASFSSGVFFLKIFLGLFMPSINPIVTVKCRALETVSSASNSGCGGY